MCIILQILSKSFPAGFNEFSSAGKLPEVSESFILENARILESHIWYHARLYIYGDRQPRDPPGSDSTTSEMIGLCMRTA